MKTVASVTLVLRVEVEQEADGRWLADVPKVPGAMAYGATAPEALHAARAIVQQVLHEEYEVE